MQQFNIGDWVVHSGNPFKSFKGTKQIKEIKNNNSYLIENQWLTSNQLEFWQPKQDEWCWFQTCNCGFELGQFIEHLSSEQYRYRLNSTNSLFNCNYCEPFIGELPSFLKENKCQN